MEVDRWKTSYRQLADFFETKGDSPLTRAEVTVCLEWLREAVARSEAHALVSTPAATIPSTPLMTPAKQPITKPATVRRSARKASQNANILTDTPLVTSSLVPVKKEIKALLEQKLQLTKVSEAKEASSMAVASDNMMSVDLSPQKSTVSAQSHTQPPVQQQQPIVVTKTAKTILDVLGGRTKSRQAKERRTLTSKSSPIKNVEMTIPEEELPVVELPAAPPKSLSPPIIDMTDGMTMFEDKVHVEGQTTDAIMHSPVKENKFVEELPSYSFDIGEAETATSDSSHIEDKSLPSYTFE